MMTKLLHEPRFRTDIVSHGHEGSRANEQQQSRVNVGEKERNVSMAAGAIVALQGLRRMTLPGLLEAAVGGFLIYRGATGHCAVYQGLGLDTYHTDGRAPADEITEKGVHVEQSMLIQRPAEELYAFWRDFQNLPRIMSHLALRANRRGHRRECWTGPKAVALTPPPPAGIRPRSCTSRVGLCLRGRRIQP